MIAYIFLNSFIDRYKCYAEKKSIGNFGKFEKHKCL